MEFIFLGDFLNNFNFNIRIWQQNIQISSLHMARNLISNPPWGVGNRCPMYKVGEKVCSTFRFPAKLIRKRQNCFEFHVM